MIEWPPGSILLLGALFLPLVPERWRSAIAVALPLVSFFQLVGLEAGHRVSLSAFGQLLTPIRVDRLSLVWGYVFHIAAAISALYGFHEKDRIQNAAGLAYAGSAIAAVFAGDLATLFVFWELTAVTSVFLIWACRTAHAYRVGMRYLVIQVSSGVLLLAGLLLHAREAGSLAFESIGLSSAGGVLICLAFGIKCAFPFLHNWLQDSYPEATVVGAVYLSAFTTKLAVYALARGFAGEGILVPIGVAMTLFPIVYAVIENDLRRVLAYSLNNQLGYMVVGIGVGTELAINGAAAHAFAHILYKGLLFMAMGAVLYRAGTIRASELGGLHKSMPVTTILCIIGSLSISGFPLLSGFVTKSMTLTAVAEQHWLVASVLLLVASAGVVDHSGIKIPFFAFFAHDQGLRVKEAPWNMLVAMGIAAAFCVGIGLYPAPLYALLPYPVDYVPYTAAHVVTSLQLLLFAALAFAVLYRKGWYPPELRATNLDFDWVYRWAAPRAVHWSRARLAAATSAARAAALNLGRPVAYAILRLWKPPGPLGEPWTVGTTSLWAALLLSVCLLLYYV